MKKIIAVFVCVLLLFSCNKNNKTQDNKIENEIAEEQIENNEDTAEEISDDDSEEDINSPYSAFYFTWENTREQRILDPYLDYICKEQQFLTITKKSIEIIAYEENIYDDGEQNKIVTEWNIENTVWKPTTIQDVVNIAKGVISTDTIKKFSNGYKVTGTIKLIEGNITFYDPQITWYVFLQKNNPSIMLAFFYNNVFNTSGAFEYHKQKEN
jgi:hypothetical protein